MTKFYHGTESDNIENIKKIGLLPAIYSLKRNGFQKYVFLTRDRKYAESYGDNIVEFNIPKSKIYTGGNEVDWISSGKPVWDKSYKPEALANGVPRKYIKAITINGKRFKI